MQPEEQKKKEEEGQGVCAVELCVCVCVRIEGSLVLGCHYMAITYKQKTTKQSMGFWAALGWCDRWPGGGGLEVGWVGLGVGLDWQTFAK